MASPTTRHSDTIKDLQRKVRSFVNDLVQERVVDCYRTYFGYWIFISDVDSVSGDRWCLDNNG